MHIIERPGASKDDLLSRLAPDDLDGMILPPGSALSRRTISAMRDPGCAPDPDTFDLRREARRLPHPVFRLGPHRCLGERPARMELEESLAALLAAAPEIEMATPPRMQGFGGLRRISPMEVRLS